MKWSERPMLRILLLLLLGILMAGYLPDGDIAKSTIGAVFILLIVSAILFTVVKTKSIRYRLIGYFLGFAVILSGILLVKSFVKPVNEAVCGHKIPVLAVVNSNPVETDKTIGAVVKISGVLSDSLKNIIGERIQCYFEKDNCSKTLEMGDVIIMECILNRPQATLNPMQFDYSEYLFRNGIAYAVFLKSGTWQKTDENKANFILYFAGKLRYRMLELLEKNNMNQNDYAVAAAILLGYDDCMDDDLRENYVRAGAMHILCVSGLHVGIIYLAVNFILSLILKRRGQKWSKACLLLLTVWFYALLTGLSPSVQRASIMLSVIILGDLLKRNKDTYNSIAASAVILLISDPMLIYNIGFQLSYAAVTGIVTFHRPIYNLFYVRNVFVDKIWEITALSISAQLATFPLAIYYFHFFPTWFLVSNLFTFPLSFAVIIIGFVFMIFSWIPVVGEAVGFALTWLIYSLNYLIEFIKYLPVSGIEGLFLTKFRLVIIYLIIATGFSVFLSGRLRRLPAFLALIALFLAAGFVNNVILRKEVMAVFHLRKHTVIAFIDEESAKIITDDEVIDEPELMDFNLENYFSSLGVTENIELLELNSNYHSSNLIFSKNFILYRDLKILLNNDKTMIFNCDEKLKVDYVIFSGKKCNGINDLKKAFLFDKIILDSSVPFYLQKRISDSANVSGILCYNVSENGAFIRSMN